MSQPAPEMRMIRAIVIPDPASGITIRNSMRTCQIPPREGGRGISRWALGMAMALHLFCLCEGHSDDAQRAEEEPGESAHATNLVAPQALTGPSSPAAAGSSG